MLNHKRFLFRIFVPTFPNFSIYSALASKTTAIGPILVATHASKLEKWDVEVIDENNCHGRFFPKNQQKTLNHELLQEEGPADVVGFYASISSTMPRVYELAKFYKDLGAKTVAGGKHVETMVEEALDHGIDAVVLGEGELTINDLLLAWERKEDLSEVQGIAFRKGGNVCSTPKRSLIHDFDTMPMPNFDLMRYAKIKLYPVVRTRGCNSNCEFCAVKEKARCASPQYMLKQIRHLVETRGARRFFEASDHFAANREEAIEFCRLLAIYQKKNGIRLRITVQTRITDARYPELLEAMKQANISMVCIGYESPFDEELIAMKKGYLSKDLINWTNTFHKYGFFIHGMFMFGYPQKPGHSQPILPMKQRTEFLRDFIKKAKIDTLQVLLTIPLPGTELRDRLIGENRAFSINNIGWEYYDGQYPLYIPDNGEEPEDLQRNVLYLMHTFYNFSNFWKVSKNILIHFPLIMFPISITIAGGRVAYIKAAFRLWYRKYFRNCAVRFGAYFVVRGWFREFKKDRFLEKLNNAKLELKQQDEKPTPI